MPSRGFLGRVAVKYSGEISKQKKNKKTKKTQKFWQSSTITGRTYVVAVDISSRECSFQLVTAPYQNFLCFFGFFGFFVLFFLFSSTHPLFLFIPS